MGNKSSAQAQLEEFQNNYVKHGEEDNKNYGHVSYYHNKYSPQEMVMLRSQWSNSLAESEDMDAIISNRQNFSHPNIAKTQSYIKQDEKQWCSTFRKHTTAFEFHENNLEAEIAKRVSSRSVASGPVALTEPEFWYLTNSLVSADTTMAREGNAYHGNLQPSTVMLDNNGIVKILDNQLVHFNKNTYQRMLYDRNVKAPLSPNLLAQLKEKKVNPTYDPSKEESWALGMTALCAATNTNLDYFYDWKVPELKWHNIHDKLDSVNGPYSKQVHGFIESCLEETEERRPSLEDHERFLRPYTTEINSHKLDFKTRNVNTEQVINKPGTHTIEEHTVLPFNGIIDNDDDFFNQKVVIERPVQTFVQQLPPQPAVIQMQTDNFFDYVEVVKSPF